MSFNASNSAVVHGFQAFYYELLRQKEKALSLYLTNEPVKAKDLSSDIKQSTEVESSIVIIQKKLVQVIENISALIVAKSQLSTRHIEEAKYIITVLADETFINLNWEGAELWKLYLLEKKLFQSEIAGDRFFEMADGIVNEVNNEEMAFLYLMVLSLGFKGKYRDSENADEHLNWYKSKLYSLIHMNTERLFYPGRSYLIESCYEYTYTEGNNTLLPDTRYWSLCILGILMLYMIISYIVWFSITDDIDYVMGQIAEQTRRSPMV